MAEPELMSIGTFAKRVGLTASALRFYDDAGLLPPAQIDPLTGYRFYEESQLAPASQLRQLREIGMSLPSVDRFFAADTSEAVRLIDDQVAGVAAEARRIQRVAATLRASLGTGDALTLGVLSGPVLAMALDQILATTACDPEFPVLAGVRVEATPDAISLIATDRYRLAKRTLVPSQPSTTSWAGTLVGDDLQAAASRLRRSPIVTLEAGDRALDLRMNADTVAHCRLLAEGFPDFGLLIESLGVVTHRVTIEARQMLAALEQAPAKVGLRITADRASLVLPDNCISLNGTATGPELLIWFELTNLYPALSHALGNDVMLDLRGADQAATVRSAIEGDLITLVMPCRPGSF